MDVVDKASLMLDITSWSWSAGNQPTGDLVVNPLLGQACHYLSRHRASQPIDQYQILLLDDEALLAQSGCIKVAWPAIEPVPLNRKSDALIVTSLHHTSVVKVFRILCSVYTYDWLCDCDCFAHTCVVVNRWVVTQSENLSTVVDIYHTRTVQNSSWWCSQSKHFSEGTFWCNLQFVSCVTKRIGLQAVLWVVSSNVVYRN